MDFVDRDHSGGLTPSEIQMGLLPSFFDSARVVDVGEEDQKGGCPVGELPALLEQARQADIPLAGLMCLPPQDIEPTPFFAFLDKLARDHGL